MCECRMFIALDKDIHPWTLVVAPQVVNGCKSGSDSSVAAGICKCRFCSSHIGSNHGVALNLGFRVCLVLARLCIVLLNQPVDGRLIRYSLLFQRRCMEPRAGGAAQDADDGSSVVDQRAGEALEVRVGHTTARRPYRFTNSAKIVILAGTTFALRA